MALGYDSHSPSSRVLFAIGESRRTVRSRRPSGLPIARDSVPGVADAVRPVRPTRVPTRTGARGDRSRPPPAVVPTRENAAQHAEILILLCALDPPRATLRPTAASVGRDRSGDAARRSARFVAAHRRPAAPGAPRDGWPVMLKSCVSRSIAARIGSGVPVTSTVVAPRGGAAIRQRRQQQRVALVERAIDRARQRLSQIHRADVVLREEIAPHLQPDADARRIEGRRIARGSARDTAMPRAARCAGRHPASTAA